MELEGVTIRDSSVLEQRSTMREDDEIEKKIEDRECERELREKGRTLGQPGVTSQLRSRKDCRIALRISRRRRRKERTTVRNEFLQQLHRGWMIHSASHPVVPIALLFFSFANEGPVLSIVLSHECWFPVHLGSFQQHCDSTIYTTGE